MSEAPRVAESDNGRIMAIVAYVLFLVGVPTVHLSSVVGVILAYIQRNDWRGTMWESHFEAMITTFWISFIVGLISIPLCFVVIGIPILIGVVVWFLYRNIRGLIHAIESKPY